MNIHPPNKRSSAGPAFMLLCTLSMPLLMHLFCNMQAFLLATASIQAYSTGCIKKVDKSEIALHFVKRFNDCTNIFIEVDCFGTYNVE